MLEPIEVALERLKIAYAMVSATEPNYSEALALVRRAGDNCYVYDTTGGTLEEKVSAIQSEKKLAEVCTFRLVVKNIVLSKDQEYLRANAYDAIDAAKGAMEALDAQLLQATRSTAPDAAAVKAAFGEAMDAYRVVAARTREALRVA
ncbi:unnamed protein product [Pedinophyceae sp. YPF-701]|nr:unnamed protein product [Pedinophyceae sp. YPF-701]